MNVEGSLDANIFGWQSFFIAPAIVAISSPAAIDAHYAKVGVDIAEKCLLEQHN